MSGWQTIDSAPKDETRLLLFADGVVEIGHYVSPFGWWLIPTAEYDNELSLTNVTHWQPLPEPPS